jgi:plasmid stabilization system protein ParE
MTPRFLFRPAAVDELREARDWYEAQRAGLGAELGQVVSGSLEHIAAQPAAFPEVVPGVRRAVIDRFPYGIFYRQIPDAIEVLAVFHHRRDPSIWRARAAV